MTSAHAGRRAVTCALAAIVLWGSLAAVGLRLRAVPPFLLVGCALLLGAAAGAWSARGLSRRDVRPRLLLLGVYGLFAYHFCLFLALRLAPPVEANLVNYLWPLLIVVLAPAFFPGTRLRARHVAGALLGFGGAALLVTGGRAGFSGDPRGYALALAAAVIWSTYSLATKRAGGFPTAAVSPFCAASGLLALLCHLVLEPRHAFTAAELPWLLALGLGPMGAAFYLWDRAMKDGDPRVVGTLAYLTPLLSTTLVVVLGEGRAGPLAAVAGAMIVGGAALGTIGGRTARGAASPARQKVEQSIEKR